MSDEQQSTKQVIVMRTDTVPAMRKGKMIAQGAHAAMAFLTSRMQTESSMLNFDVLDLSEEAMRWLGGDMTKICVRAESLRELMDVYDKAKELQVEAHIIEDKGYTEFSGPTKTCLAIGPDHPEKVDKITGHLKLL